MATFNHSRTNIIRLILISVFVIMLLQLFNLQVLSGTTIDENNFYIIGTNPEYSGIKNAVYNMRVYIPALSVK